MGHLSLGVTGTRKGWTAEQKFQFCHTLGAIFEPQSVTLHHGDAVGVDAQMHNLLSFERPIPKPLDIIIHPPTNPKHRAFCGLLDDRVTRVQENCWWWEERPYAERDEDIVLMSKIMVAFPFGYDELMRGSGTWLTIRLARKYKRPLYIFYPGGEVETERT